VVDPRRARGIQQDKRADGGFGCDHLRNQSSHGMSDEDGGRIEVLFRKVNANRLGVVLEGKLSDFLRRPGIGEVVSRKGGRMHLVAKVFEMESERGGDVGMTPGTMDQDNI